MLADRRRSGIGAPIARRKNCRTEARTGDLKAKIAAFVDHYNHRRYHESLNNLAPADVYWGRGAKILRERERIKRITIENRRLQHQTTAA